MKFLANFAGGIHPKAGCIYSTCSHVLVLNPRLQNCCLNSDTCTYFQEDYLDCGFNSIKELEDYADDTNTAQLCLLLQCLGRL